MDEHIVQAYRATDYNVCAASRFTLRIDETCSGCDAAMDAHDVAMGACLTAWNPYSQQVSDAENAHAQEKLAADLAAENIAVLPAEGVGRAGDWPSEMSLFALGISREKAVSLAQKYRQNAFVWIERGKAAELVLCVDMTGPRSHGG